MKKVTAADRFRAVQGICETVRYRGQVVGKICLVNDAAHGRGYDIWRVGSKAGKVRIYGLAGFRKTKREARKRLFPHSKAVIRKIRKV